MVRFREIMRLHSLGQPIAAIARAVGCTRKTVGDVIHAAEAVGLSWPLPADMGDEAIRRLIFPKNFEIRGEDTVLPEQNGVERSNDNALTGYPSIDRPWTSYYSEEALASIPFQGTIYQHIIEANKDCPDDIALIYFGRKITHSEMSTRIDAVAEALASMGIGKGDNVSMLVGSCPEAVYSMLAVNKIGAFANMVEPPFGDDQIKGRIMESEPKVIFVLDQLFGAIEEILDDLPKIQIVVIRIAESMPLPIRFLAGIKLRKNIPYGSRIIRYTDFVAPLSSPRDLSSCQDESLPAFMVHSSGTTGTPKGIVLTNKSINATINNYEGGDFSCDRGQTFLSIVPPFSSTGLVICLLMPLCMGATVILEPAFSGKSFARDIEKYSPSMTLSPISHWIYAEKTLDPSKVDLSPMKYPISGGEKVLPETENCINSLLKACGCAESMIVGYGLCELGGTVTTTSTSTGKKGSVGYPILGSTVSAFNIETNEECRYGERGEIRVLTPTRMQGYYKRPDATAKFFWKDSQGNEWGCTGDVGYVDMDGFVYVEGRATDFFNTAAGRRYCFDVEDVILQHEDVDQCEVVGEAGGNGFDVPIAFVVLKKGAEPRLATEELRTLCEASLEPECVPVAFRAIDGFPVKPSGKRDMDAVKEMAVSLISSAQ